MFEDQQKAHLIAKLYQQPQNIDLYLAILGEKHVKGAVLGELGIKINAFQFKRIRNGDRFWYENSYPKEIVKEIKETSFADLLRRNAGVKCINKCAFKKV
jgi:peroxidase